MAGWKKKNKTGWEYAKKPFGGWWLLLLAGVEWIMWKEEEEEEEKERKSGRRNGTVRAVCESKSPLLKLTSKPVAVGTAPSTVTQVFLSIFHSKKITSATHALFLINSATSSRLVELVFIPGSFFPIHPQEEEEERKKQNFRLWLCVHHRRVRGFLFSPKCQNFRIAVLYRDPNNWLNFLENIKWHGVCLDLTSLPTKDYIHPAHSGQLTQQQMAEGKNKTKNKLNFIFPYWSLNGVCVCVCGYISNESERKSKISTQKNKFRNERA